MKAITSKLLSMALNSFSQRQLSPGNCLFALNLPRTPASGRTCRSQSWGHTTSGHRPGLSLL